jgi:hypothetical protein
MVHLANHNGIYPWLHRVFLAIVVDEALILAVAAANLLKLLIVGEKAAN